MSAWRVCVATGVITTIIAVTTAQVPNNDAGFVGLDRNGDLQLRADINPATGERGAIRLNGIDYMNVFSQMQSSMEDMQSSMADMQSTIESQASTIAAQDSTLSLMNSTLSTIDDQFNRGFGHMFVPTTSPSTSNPTGAPSETPSTSPTVAPTISPTAACGGTDANNNGLLDNCETVGPSWSRPGQYTWVVPFGVNMVYADVRGAKGWSGSHTGGEGGITTGILHVHAGDTLHVFVGGQGTVAPSGYRLGGAGYNGGGHGRSNSASNAVGGGGGASDIRIGNITLNARMLVAGGGGSSTNNGNCHGGRGGGAIGQNSYGCSYTSGTGGRQSSGGNHGGAFGQGGNGDTGTPWNGGGGGGWWGGGASTAHGGGGGGSSYINSTVTRGSMRQGGQNGDGRVSLWYSRQ